MNVNLEAARRFSERLTPREWHVMLELLKGKTQPEIAKQLGCRCNNISNTKKRIFVRLNLWSDVELGAFAVANGLVEYKSDSNHLMPRVSASILCCGKLSP